VQRLREIGIQPNFIIARSKKPLSKKARNKISLFCNVGLKNIISGYDVEDIYTIPINFVEQDLDISLLKFFNLKPRKAKLHKWKEIIKKKKNAKTTISIGLIGKYSALKDSYLSIEQALNHCEYALSIDIDLEFVDAEDIVKNIKILDKYDGIIVPGGFGVRGSKGKINAITYARQNNVPFLGLCLGFQLAIIEFAKNVLKFRDVNSTEFGKTKNPVIYLLPNQDLNNLGGTMRLGNYLCSIRKDSLAYNIYKQEKILERHRHRYEFNNSYREQFENAGMVFSGINPKQQLVEILEIPQHKFFIATQFHPEFNSKLEKPSPMFLSFVKACIK
jgi:CTP synthase